MSKVKIQPNASGTANFTIAAPATNTDRTLTLPDVDATVLTTAGGTINGAIGIGVNANSGNPLTIGRVNSTNEGGQIDLCRASDNASSWGIDVYGNTSTPSLRVIDNTAAAVRLQIDGSGRVTMPSQPAFRAYKDTNQTVTNNSADIKVEYNQIYTNIGSHYSTSNFRFTAPITGLYFFNAWFMLNSYPTDAQYHFIRFVKNGSESNSEFMHRAPSGAYLTLQGATHMYLSANDYVEVYTRQAGGSSNSNIRNSFAEFQGILIG